MRHSLSPAMVGALAVVLAGCSGGQPARPSLATATTSGAAPSASPTPSPAACDARSAASQVDALLAGWNFAAHYLTINGELTISFWIVDPQIEPIAAQAGLEAGNRQALETGLLMSHRIVDEIPCVRQVFENVNPMIVDSRYQGWYIDVIPARAFVGLVDPTTSQLIEVVGRSGAGPAAGRRSLPSGETPAPSGSCTWAQARSGVTGQLGPAQDNTATYVIIGSGIAASRPWNGPAADVAVQAQIEAHEAADTTDEVLLDRLNRVARELACLHPSADQLEVFVVDGSGRLVVYARVPGALIGPGAGPLPPGRILLHHVSPTDEP